MDWILSMSVVDQRLMDIILRTVLANVSEIVESDCRDALLLKCGPVPRTFSGLINQMFASPK